METDMSHVYLEDGTAIPVLRFDMGVTVTDLQTDSVLWSGDVPAHLAEHYSTEEAAEWGTQWVDAAYGLQVLSEHDTTDDDVVTFGMLGHSYVEHFRAGARYSISVTVAGKGKGFTVTAHGETATFLTEKEAGRYAYYSGPGATLGITEVTL
jgi:hypothetical protein